MKNIIKKLKENCKFLICLCAGFLPAIMFLVVDIEFVIFDFRSDVFYTALVFLLLHLIMTVIASFNKTILKYIIINSATYVSLSFAITYMLYNFKALYPILETFRGWNIADIGFIHSLMFNSLSLINIIIIVIYFIVCLCKKFVKNNLKKESKK